METSEAFERRAGKPVGQVAYEKYQETLGEAVSSYDELSLAEQDAWFRVAVESWKALRERNEGKVYLT